MPAATERPDVTAALESQLGLSLRRLEVESAVLVIDRAERPQELPER